MNKKRLFAFLEAQPASVLIEFLAAAYDEMTTEQRWAVLGRAVEKAKPLPADGPSLLKRVLKFKRDSLAGKYYAPFDINSKNFMHVPEKTRLWFDTIGDLLGESAEVSLSGDHTHAVECFQVLHDLIEHMENGEEIVFADEYGTWMIAVDFKPLNAAYFASLAATATPESYAAAALPLIRRDAYESFSKKTFAAANRAATKAQKVFLKAEVARQGIRTKPDARR